MDGNIETLTGQNDIELSSLDWLELHHRVKLPDRRAILSRLDIREGDRVLDLGCGPGFWVQLIADIVGPAGAVVGADFDEGLLNHAARAVAESHPEHDVSFRTLSFEDLDDRVGDFDVVFFSNCFCYVVKPEDLMARMAGRLRKGGRLIGRNWDGGVFMLNPLPELQLAKMQFHLAEVFGPDRLGPHFDNYFGRKLPGLFRRHGFNDVKCETQVIERFGPADRDLARYIQMNGEWMAETVGNRISDEERRQWLTYFDAKDARCVFASEEFYFCMIELAVTGYV